MLIKTYSFKGREDFVQFGACACLTGLEVRSQCHALCCASSREQTEWFLDIRAANCVTMQHLRLIRPGKNSSQADYRNRVLLVFNFRINLKNLCLCYTEFHAVYVVVYSLPRQYSYLANEEVLTNFHM